MILRRTALGLAVAATAVGAARAQVGKVDRIDVVDAVPGVAGQQGAELSLTLRITGKPDGAIVSLREIWRPPSPGLRNPATGAVRLESETEFKAPLNTNVRRAFALDQPWKVVRGEWVVEYWDGVRKMMQRKFVVQ